MTGFFLFTRLIVEKKLGGTSFLKEAVDLIPEKEKKKERKKEKEGEAR